MDALKLAGVKNLPAFTSGRRRMILPIFQFGDPILRAKGERIEKIDERIRQLAVNMIETNARSARCPGWQRSSRRSGCNSPC